MLLIRSFLLILITLACGLARADVILVWGDSLSAGYGLARGQAWPDLLKTRLTEEGFKKFTVVNASVSGETSAGGLTRLEAALKSHQPGIVILELGANDGLRGLPPTHMEQNLRSMIQLAEGAGARVMLVGMQMPPNFGPAYTRRFAEVYQRLADEYRLPFLPFLFEGMATRQELFQPDGLHPTAEAQTLLLENVWGPLKTLLR